MRAAASGCLMGIECDGRTYHSSKTARDRDCLRQQHLEHMGWTIHRIWSSDWWRNPDGEIERVLKHLREAEQLRPMREPIAEAPGAIAAIAITEDEGGSSDLSDDEELFDDEETSEDQPVEQDEPTPDAQAVFATPAETPSPRMSEEELVLTLRERPLEVIDHRATGGVIWVIGNEKDEAFMRRLERETGFVFEFVRYGDLVTRHRPAWRLKRS
jgi:hypothetical protein